MNAANSPANRGGATPTGRASDELLGTDLDSIGMHDLAARARASEFNDYFGEHDMPQHALIALVHTDSRGSHEQRMWLVGNVVEGKYDGTNAEADEWGASEEGRETFAELTQVLGEDPTSFMRRRVDEAIHDAARRPTSVDD